MNKHARCAGFQHVSPYGLHFQHAPSGRFQTGVTEVETERLLLRGWRDEDFEPYAHMCPDPEAMRFIGDGSTLTREQSGEQISRFVRHWEERSFGLWAVEERATGAFVGFVGLAYQEG